MALDVERGRGVRGVWLSLQSGGFRVMYRMSNDLKLESEKQQLLENVLTFDELMEASNALYKTNSFHPLVPEEELSDEVE